MTDSRARLIVLLGATAAAALALASLLPTKWIPRTGLGWEDEHFIVYFATTIVLSLASRRPYVVGVALMMFAGVLEACQGLTPDRFPDLTSAYGRGDFCCLVGELPHVGQKAVARQELPEVLSAMAPISSRS